MATILGEANLSTSFTAFADDTRVATHDTNRDTTTDYRRPLIIRKDDIVVTTPTDPLLQYHNNTGADYNRTTAVGDPKLSIIRGNASVALELQFDFTDIDQDAVFDTNSLEIELDIQSGLKGHSGFSGNQNTGDPYFGSFRLSWDTEDSDYSIPSSPIISDEIKITSEDRQTITTQIPGHFTTGGNMGANPTLTITFLPVVNNPLAVLPTIPSGSNFSYANRGIDSTSGNIEMYLYSVKARYNYTGRTFITTGYQSFVNDTFSATTVAPTSTGDNKPSSHPVGSDFAFFDSQDSFYNITIPIPTSITNNTARTEELSLTLNDILVCHRNNTSNYNSNQSVFGFMSVIETDSSGNSTTHSNEAPVPLTRQFFTVNYQADSDGLQEPFPRAETSSFNYTTFDDSAVTPKQTFTIDITDLSGWDGIFDSGSTYSIGLHIRTNTDSFGTKSFGFGVKTFDIEQTVAEGDYRFASMIPDDQIYKGLGAILRLETGSGTSSSTRVFTLKNNTNDNIFNATGTNAKTAPPYLAPLNSINNIAGGPGSGVLTGSPEAVLYQQTKYSDRKDDGLTNEVAGTISMFRDQNLDTVVYIGGNPVVLLRKELNIAYMSEINGVASLSTSFTTTVTPALTHGLTPTEIGTLSSSFTMTTLGGFRLKDPQPEVDLTFNVDVAANNLLTTSAQPLSTSFSTTVSASNIKSSTIPTMGMAFGVTVAGTVLIDTALAGPIQMPSEFVLTSTANNIIAVTGLNPAQPSAAIAIASLSESAGDIDIIRAPSGANKVILTTETRTYITDEFDRTITPDPFTRIFTVNKQDRTITVDRFTTTVDARDLL